MVDITIVFMGISWFINQQTPLAPSCKNLQSLGFFGFFPAAHMVKSQRFQPPGTRPAVCCRTFPRTWSRSTRRCLEAWDPRPPAFVPRHQGDACLWCVVGMAREPGVLVEFEVILVKSQQIQWGKPRKCREFWWILVVASIKDVGIQHEDIGKGTDEWSVNGSCLFHLLWNDFHGEIFSVCWCKHVKGPKKSDPK